VIDYDYAQRRVIDQSTRRRTSPCLIDFTTINDSDRRDRRRADRSQLNTLWDKRTGDENRLLFNILLTFGSLLDRGIGEHRSGKHAGCHQNYCAFPYRRLHEQKLHPGSCSVQIIEAMTMAPPDQSKRGNSGCHCLSADLTKTSVLEFLR